MRRLQTPPPNLPDEARSARRARYFLYLLGAVFVALGFALEMVPALAAVAPDIGGRVCAGIGTVILAAGRFGSDRFVCRCEMVLTGWP
ncbi:MAG: hypothetical protein ABI885_06375 [Gammaproteobacteria bacterium]